VKILITILLIFIGTILISFNFFSITIYVTGHLRKNPSDTSGYVKGLTVFVKGNGIILAKTVTDKKGNFHLHFTDKGQKSFDFFCTGDATDTLLLSSITRFESDTPDIIFLIPAKRMKNSLGQTICPKCRKADKVYRIVYADKSAIKILINNGDTSYSPINKEETVVGLFLQGIGKYYCSRDKVKF
jgi:hypothetical protein